jgi:SAM-dependent methyltransferase
VDEGLQDDPRCDEALRPGDHPNALVRRALARQLRGDGVEFGPGCHPLPLGPLVSRVRYWDRLDRSEFAALFPEVGEAALRFPDPLDFHLDMERIDASEVLGRESVDFVVASHVLEHLVDPLRFLERCHQILRPGGLLYLVVPDPRALNEDVRGDRDRGRTRLEELVERRRRGATDLSDDALARIVNETERPQPPFGPDSPDYRRRLELHRRRSVHVNVWLVEDLVEMMEYVGRSLGCVWEMVDGLVCSSESIFVFRRGGEAAALDRYPTVLSRIWFDSHRHALSQSVGRRLSEAESLLLAAHDRLMTLDERSREVQQFVRRVKELLRRAPGGVWLERRLRKDAED